MELNKDYALIISTNAGLWRYLIGDTVRFTDLNPFRIKVSGRTQSFINLAGEELVVANAEEAIGRTAKLSGAIVKEYTAAPIYPREGQLAGHQWLIEFSQAPRDLVEFSNNLDKILKELNSDYEAKRYKDLNLSRPLITLARSGLFHDWLNSKNKLGAQNKVPRLSNNRQTIEEILKLN